MQASIKGFLWLVAATILVSTVALTFTRVAASPAVVQTTALQPALAADVAAGTFRISYQGRLLDALSGQPKPDGAYTIAFRLYGVESGGAALWTESKSVPVNKGLFSTLLGDTTTLDLAIFNGQDLFLGVTVGTDPEAAPRQRVAHVAYAIFAASAGNAETLNGNAATAFAPATHAHTGADIADGSLTGADLDPNVVPKFFSLDPYSAYLEGSASFNDGFGQFAGLYLPKASPLPAFAVGFTIPPNYTTGTPLTMRLLWHTSSTSCLVDFRGNAISVARPGRNHIVGLTTTDGITIVGGELLAAPTVVNQTNKQLVVITSPDGVTNLEPGDAVIVGLYRRSDSGNDSCTTPMVIQAISVLYQ